jgi:hypothetical protein
MKDVPEGMGTVIRRTFTFKDRRYNLTLAPAFIEKPDGRIKAQFAGVREEVVEFVIQKLAIQSGYFAKGPDGGGTDSFTLLTSLYQIAHELKRRGEQRDKWASYSSDQIREALLVLAKTNIHHKSEDGDDDLVFSPIADFGFHNPDGQDRLSPKSTIYIRFNALISKSILARNWRQIDYEGVIGANNFLERWLRKMLGLRFTYAAPNRSFNIRLSTIIENSGVTLYAKLSDNLAYVEQTLRAMPDVVARYSVDRQFAVHPVTGKGRVLADAKIVIHAAHRFIVDQIKTNLHADTLDHAVVSQTGTVVTEPKRADFATFQAYTAARQTYLSGTSMDQPSSRNVKNSPQV